MDETKLFEALAKVRDNLDGAAMALDELIQKQGETLGKETQKMIDFDIAKISWVESRPGKNGEKTWYADNVTNKDSVDYRRLVDTMKKVQEGKGNPELFYFWTKMPEGRGFLWFDQSGNGIYRRLKKS